MDIEWLSKLGVKGLEKLMQRTVDKVIDAKVEPRFKVLESDLHSLDRGQKALDRGQVAIQNRFAALDSELRSLRDGQDSVKASMSSELKGIRDKLDALEARLHVAEEIAQLKIKVARLEGRA